MDEIKLSSETADKIIDYVRISKGAFEDYESWNAFTDYINSLVENEVPSEAVEDECKETLSYGNRGLGGVEPDWGLTLPHRNETDTEIAKRMYWKWVDSVPYDVSEMMELIALDIMKDYYDWLDKQE